MGGGDGGGWEMKRSRCCFQLIIFKSSEMYSSRMDLTSDPYSSSLVTVQSVFVDYDPQIFLSAKERILFYFLNVNLQSEQQLSCIFFFF